MKDAKALAEDIHAMFPNRLTVENAEQIVNHVLSGLSMEWGIHYKDTKFPDPVRKEATARGILKNYGEIGDRLVRRQGTGWQTVETVKTPGERKDTKR